MPTKYSPQKINPERDFIFRKFLQKFSSPRPLCGRGLRGEKNRIWSRIFSHTSLKFWYDTYDIKNFLDEYDVFFIYEDNISKNTDRQRVNMVHDEYIIFREHISIFVKISVLFIFDT